MAKATETLKKSRNINISISLDAEALMQAMGNNVDEEDDTPTTAAGILRKSMDEPKIVKMSQTPMAG